MKYLQHVSYGKHEGISCFELLPEFVVVVLKGTFSPTELRAMADAVEQNKIVPDGWVLQTNGNYKTK